MSSEEFSQAIHCETSSAAIVSTSSAQNMSSGTSPLWRGTSLFLALGQSALQDLIVKNIVIMFHIHGNTEHIFFRHSATLLEKKLFIFGGQKTVAYLNDIHILDLGKGTDLMPSLNI